MTKKPTPVPADKDAIIGDLQGQIASLKDAVDYERGHREKETERADQNHKHGLQWKDAHDKLNGLIQHERRSASRAHDGLALAERRLAFAQGYIAALKGDDFPKLDLLESREFGA